MRGLNNPEEIQTDKVITVFIKEEAPPQLSVLDKIKQKYGLWKQARTGKKIEAGKIPHGRAPVIEEGTPGMGGAIIKGVTQLTAKHIRDGQVIEQRIVHNRVITTAGRDAIVDAFTGTFTLSTFNYHDCGTGTGDEAVGDTALGTAVSEARVSGTQSQPTSDVYQSVATITFSNSYAITEHGLFSQASKPGGTLLDRTKFAAINVVSGDKIEFTFTATFASGG